MYGRIVHLQPVTWKDGWPLMGIDQNNDGVGEPVHEYKKPDVGRAYPAEAPQTSDEFAGSPLGLQWQWYANPKKGWHTLVDKPGYLRLFAVKNHTQNGNLWFAPNLLLQKFPAPSFTATAKVSFHGEHTNDRGGLVVMGKTWRYISLMKTADGVKITMRVGEFNQCDDMTVETGSADVGSSDCYLRVSMDGRGVCRFSYSIDNIKYTSVGVEGAARKGRWIGAKLGLFCQNPNIMESRGYLDVDWFRIE